MKTELAVQATPTKISRRLTIEQAFHEIASNCLGQIQANRLGIVKHRDPESLHQMRIGLRRLDAALELFTDFVLLPEDIQTELAWLSKNLGAARDWDVLQKSTLPRLVGAIGEKESCLLEIEAAVADESNEKYDAAIKALNSDRYRKLMKKIEVWLQNRDGWIFASANNGRQSVARIPDFAQALLSHEQHRLLKRGEKLQGAPPKALHKVRIAAKRARYATEFFDDLLNKDTTKRYIKSLAFLQDKLGYLNDMSVAGSLLEELAGRHSNLEENIHFIRGYLAAYAESEAKKIKMAWKAFRKSDFPHQ